MRKTSTERVRRFRERNPWFRPWEYARRRCTDTKHKEYPNYGGIGIRCTLTREEVISLFIRDGGAKLSRPSLDRLDPDGHYSFENCRYIEWYDNIKDRRPPYGKTPRPVEIAQNEEIVWSE